MMAEEPPLEPKRINRSLSDEDRVYAKGNPTLKDVGMAASPSRISHAAWEEPSTSQQYHHQRTSLDETNQAHNHFRPQQPAPHNSHAPMAPRFHPGHRRVRSGDAPWHGNNPLTFQNYPNYSNIQRMSNSYSMIDMHSSQTPNSVISGMYPTPPHQRNNMVHSISVDLASNSEYVHKHLVTQSTSFVRLQDAIAKDSLFKEQLEQDISSGEKELNALFTAENPTEKDYRQLREENDYLQRELAEMAAELDKLGIPFPGDPSTKPLVGSFPPPPPPRPAPLAKIISNPNDDSLAHHPYGPKNSTVTPPITVEPPNYKHISDPPPFYHDVVPSREVPPPIPPRPPRAAAEEEKWNCPKCTFENLLVSECEMCYTPKPIALNRPR